MNCSLFTNLTTFPTKVLGIERKVIGQHHASAVLYEHRFIQNQQTIPILATIIDYHHFKNVQEASSEDHFQFSAAISDVHVDSNELITDDYDGIIILRSSFYHYVRLVMKFMTCTISKHGASFVFITMVWSVNLLNLSQKQNSHRCRLLGS